MGPGRTGVKGVIRDRAEAEGLARAKRADETTALNRAMEKASLGGKTWGEEEKERLAELARQEARSGAGAFKAATKGRFGHLREVGVRSYVQAVEEDRNVWVAVHIYDSVCVRSAISCLTICFVLIMIPQSLERCAALDEVLSRLARSYPFTKFLRARAGAIGFASSAPATSNLASQSGFNLSRFPKRGLTVSSRSRIDEKDEFFDDEVDDDGEDEADEVDEDRWEDDEVDTDVLPTLLVYRGGELVHSWVRVDWEAKQGVEELLKRYARYSCHCVGTEPDDSSEITSLHLPGTILELRASLRSMMRMNSLTMGRSLSSEPATTSGDLQCSHFP